MAAEPGLRERKKEQTRRAIAEVARRLFIERGFDAVTVAEVARIADVSIGTVFNYFPTKEDLFYSEMEVFEAALVEAVRARPAGESVLAAFRDFIIGRSKLLAEEERADIVATAARIVEGSAALQAREREIVAHYTNELAMLIAQETRAAADDVEPLAVASALMGGHRSLVDYVRSSAVAGKRGPKLAADLRSQAKRAFARLERGLGGYAIKPG
jgi:AcrR family transcriptional regulator